MKLAFIIFLLAGTITFFVMRSSKVSDQESAEALPSETPVAPTHTQAATTTSSTVPNLPVATTEATATPSVTPLAGIQNLDEEEAKVDNDSKNEEVLPSSGPKLPITKARLEDLQNFREVRKFLKDARKENLLDTLAKATPLTRDTEMVNRLSGRFQGTVRVEGPTRKRWQMVMDSTLRVEDNQLKGETRISLSDNGKEFSVQTGRGTLKEFQSTGDGPGVIVQASPDAYFELFYLNRYDVFVGNYYKQSNAAVIVPQGTVRLTR